MQAQVTRAEVQSITATQSLAAIQTMLRAGLGCITYLRDLLPEENFTQSHLVASEDSICYRRSEDTSFSSASSNQSRGSNGFKITTMTRGYSDEGDKLLNYLENGIFDALQKEYLKSFIFAIYLDHNDPNNIVEAYTFNFQYHTSPDTGITVPIMTLGEDLRQMSLNNVGDNPVTEAAKRGRAPTLLEVKKSVKALLKTLITVTTQMDVLPKRRFATFKLYYTDKAPADYEPPHFQPGDQDKDKWYFMTHDLDEVPDKWSIGKVNTGHHSINLSVTSIATYLPANNPLDDFTFGGMTLRSVPAPALTPAQEAGLRAAQVEQQIMDAITRNIAWSGDHAVELDDADGEGEDDPDYVRLPDGTYVKKVANDVPGPLIPSGIRNNETGVIEPLCGPMDIEEAHFTGVSEKLPTKLNELNRENVDERSNVEQTQVVDDLSTQDVPLLSPSPDNRSSTSTVTVDPIFQSSRYESTWSSPPMSPITSAISRHGSDTTDIDMVKDMHTQPILNETAPLDMETQAESIESFGSELDVKATEKSRATYRRTSSMGKSIPDHGLECDCGVNVEDSSCFCEGGCGRWFHIWCMGYHSVDDPRLPSEFHCFSCRLKAANSWPLITDLYPTILSKFQDLALFRRSIKIAETLKGTFVTADFTKANGTSRDVSRRLIGRLEREGLLTQQITVLDDLGFPQNENANIKGNAKAKQSKARKNMQPKTFIVNREALSSVKYTEYFNPDPAVERRLLKIAELTSRLKPSRKIVSTDTTNTTTSHLPRISLQETCEDTQTQMETQIAPSEVGLKRINPVHDNDGTPKHRRKKIKISVTHGLDLAE